MKQKIVVLLVLLLATSNGYAIKLNEQIKQNVDEAWKSYQQLVHPKLPRLWIQVRTPQQQELILSVKDKLNLDNSIILEPVQLVKDGPKKPQLRFFSLQDKEKAAVLLKKLQKFFPDLELQDFSAEYGVMGWMESGHFELWLSPDVKKIALPLPEVTPPPSPANPVPSVTKP